MLHNKEALAIIGAFMALAIIEAFMLSSEGSGGCICLAGMSSYTPTTNL